MDNTITDTDRLITALKDPLLFASISEGSYDLGLLCDWAVRELERLSKIEEAARVQYDCYGAYPGLAEALGEKQTQDVDEDDPDEQEIAHSFISSQPEGEWDVDELAGTLMADADNCVRGKLTYLPSARYLAEFCVDHQRNISLTENQRHKAISKLTYIIFYHRMTVLRQAVLR